MSAIFLSPHHLGDDETLFGAYLCLRYRPHVLVCYPGAPRHGSPETRQRETDAAMGVLGCEATAVYGDGVDLDEAIVAAAGDTGVVLAPLPEDRGNSDHNRIGNLAARLFPGRVVFYTTYTDRGRSTCGERVDVQPGWETLKRLALACYPSQMRRPGTRVHFERPIDEYVVAGC